MSSQDPKRIVCCHLGRMDYAPAWALQQQIQSRLIEAYRAGRPDEVPNVLLLVEHPPVYTLGKSGRIEHLLISEDERARRGIEFFHIGRGGDITYHGPGQLVGYPILDLHRFYTDLGRYLRSLEEVIIRTCADFGVTAGRSDIGTGVWVGEEPNERKICAFGIRCSRWVTLHGFAFNVNTDLSYFDLIVPCGIRERGVTSLALELGRPVDESAVRGRVMAHFETLFEGEMTRLDGRAAHEFLVSFASTPLPATP